MITKRTRSNMQLEDQDKMSNSCGNPSNKHKILLCRFGCMARGYSNGLSFQNQFLAKRMFLVIGVTHFRVHPFKDQICVAIKLWMCECVCVGGGGVFAKKNLFFGILVTILGGAFTYPIFAKERYRNGEALKMLFLKCFLGHKTI